MIERITSRPAKIKGAWLIQDESGQPLTYWMLRNRFGARQDSCRLSHAALCCLFPMAMTASRSGLRVTAVMGDQSRVRPVQRAG